MHIAILTFEGFNELDSIVALAILKRVRDSRWRVSLACPTPTVTSMNGVVVHAQATLAEASSADVVIVGSGVNTRNIVKDEGLLSQIKLVHELNVSFELLEDRIDDQRLAAMTAGQQVGVSA